MLAKGKQNDEKHGPNKLNRDWTQMLAKGKQFRLLITCQMRFWNLVHDRGIKEEIFREKIHWHLRYGYFVAVNQFVMTTIKYL
jgi:hypothetical protein